MLKQTDLANILVTVLNCPCMHFYLPSFTFGIAIKKLFVFANPVKSLIWHGRVSKRASLRVSTVVGISK